MSLVSARNLVAPLTNMVHLITIFLVAIAFAVLRFSGASLSVSGTTKPRQQIRTPATDQRTEFEQRLLDQRKPKPWEQEKRDIEVPPLPKNPGKQGGGLDDIEKALGM